MKKLIEFLKSEKIIPVLLAFFFSALYFSTLAPSLQFIDSGELAAACSTLGIAHPTGYPLFTLIGYFFSKLPFSSSEIYKLNLLSAIYCIFALFFLYKLMLLLFGKIDVFLPKKADNRKNIKNKNFQEMKPPDKKITYLSAVCTVLFLGLSRNFWETSTSIEVYPLHCLMISAVVFIFLRNILQKAESGRKKHSFLQDEKGWLVFAFVLGLSFTNHMSTVMLLPPFIYLYLVTYGIKWNSIKRILIMFIPFAVGLSVYIYYPLRAAANPEINWGNPVTLERFIWHVTGKQFQTWAFSSFGSAVIQFKYFVQIVPKDFLYIPVISAFLGLSFLFKRMRRIFYFTLIAFLSCMLIAVNYNINDIDSYFLLSYFILAVWAGFGIVTISNYLRVSIKKMKLYYYYGLLVIPLIQLSNYNGVDESKNYLVEDYTMNVFNSVKENGIVLSFQWDNWISASWYFQHAKGIRKDITVIDKELLRRSWYFTQLERNHPWLIQNSRTEVDEFLRELYKFEHDIPYDPMTIQTKFINMINSFIEKNISNRPIYVANEIEKEIGPKYIRIPEGMLNRLYSEDNYWDMPLPDIKFRPIRKRDKYIDQLLRFYGDMFVQRASYEKFHGQKQKAFWYVNKALEIIPNYPAALAYKRQMEK